MSASTKRNSAPLARRLPWWSAHGLPSQPGGGSSPVIVIAAAAIAYFAVILTSSRVDATERSRVTSFIPMFLASFVFFSIGERGQQLAVPVDERLLRGHGRAVAAGGGVTPQGAVRVREPRPARHLRGLGVGPGHGGGGGTEQRLGQHTGQPQHQTGHGDQGHGRQEGRGGLLRRVLGGAAGTRAARTDCHRHVGAHRGPGQPTAAGPGRHERRHSFEGPDQRCPLGCRPAATAVRSTCGNLVAGIADRGGGYCPSAESQAFGRRYLVRICPPSWRSADSAER